MPTGVPRKARALKSFTAILRASLALPLLRLLARIFAYKLGPGFGLLMSVFTPCPFVLGFSTGVRRLLALDTFHLFLRHTSLFGGRASLWESCILSLREVLGFSSVGGVSFPVSSDFAPLRTTDTFQLGVSNSVLLQSSPVFLRRKRFELLVEE